MADVPIELIVTDLDGTLWERPDAVPDRTRRALTKLLAGDTDVLVATGRRVVSTRDPLARLGAAPPAVVLNGALGLDLESGERFHAGGFGPGDAERVLAVFDEHSVVPCVYVDADSPSVWVGPRPSTHADHLASFGADVGSGALHDIIATEAVLAFGVLGLDEDLATRLGDAVTGVASPHVAADRQYGGFTVTVAPPDQSKWNGVASYCRARGVDPAAVLAIGDGPNDLEMLDHAAVAVVPADAHPSALALADHIIGTAADGGWADIVDLI